MNCKVENAREYWLAVARLMQAITCSRVGPEFSLVTFFFSGMTYSETLRNNGKEKQTPDAVSDA